MSACSPNIQPPFCSLHLMTIYCYVYVVWLACLGLHRLQLRCQLESLKFHPARRTRLLIDNGCRHYCLVSCFRMQKVDLHMVTHFVAYLPYFVIQTEMHLEYWCSLMRSSVASVPRVTTPFSR